MLQPILGFTSSPLPLLGIAQDASNDAQTAKAISADGISRVLVGAKDGAVSA